MAPLPGSEALLVSEVGKKTFIFCYLLSVLMDSSAVGSLLVRSRPTTVVVTPTPTEIVPYKIPTGIIDYVLANRYTGEGHPGEHLLYLSQLCSLFKLAGVMMEFVMKTLFSVLLKDVIFPRFGVPRYLMTNGGSHFT